MKVKQIITIIGLTILWNTNSFAQQPTNTSCGDAKSICNSNYTDNFPHGSNLTELWYKMDISGLQPLLNMSISNSTTGTMGSFDYEIFHAYFYYPCYSLLYRFGNSNSWPQGGISFGGGGGGLIIIRIFNIACVNCDQFQLQMHDEDPNCTIIGFDPLDVSCYGGHDGFIASYIIGNSLVPPVSALWSNGSTMGSISNLTAGIYTLTITDAVGTQFSRSWTVSQPPAITTTLNSTNVTTIGGNDGSATISASGGTPPYSFAWSNGATTTSIYNLIGGTYVVTTTDFKGCTVTNSAIITEPASLQCNITINSVIQCNGGSDGSITANVTGGSSPYSFTWSNGTNSALNSNLNAGNYEVTVMDANSNTTICNVILSEPPAVDASFNYGSSSFCQTVGNILPTITGVTGGTFTCSTLSVNPSTGLINLQSYFGLHTITYTTPQPCSISSNQTISISTIETSTNSEARTECDSYTWPINGTTYTVGGTYTHNSVTTCQESILYLTILATQIETVAVTACETYTWLLNGEIYTASGSYSHLVNTGGVCLNTILELTILPIENTEETVSSCGPYTWNANGVTYTQSGAYNTIVTDPTNEICNSIILELTITDPPTTHETVTECSSYFWDISGQTYTTSGTYTFTKNNQAPDCDDIYILYLTIVDNPDVDVYIAAVGSYFWALNNTTYSTIGLYNYTYNQTVNGCPQKTILHLTLTNDGDPTPSVPTDDCETCLGSFSPTPSSTGTERKYVISAWVREEGVSSLITTFQAPRIEVYGDLYGGTTTYGPFAFSATGLIIDGWQKIESEFVLPVNAINISILLKSNYGTSLFDDVRVYPFNASMKSFVYDPITAKLNAVLDELNYATFYEYDQEGNLVRIKKETERGIMTIQETRSNTSH